MPGPRTVYGPALARAVREGRVAEAAVELPRRVFEVWDDTTNAWAYVKGSYEISAGRSITDRRLTAPINV
jgi:beta-glucosidase